MLAAQAEQTSFKIRPYKTVSSATGDAFPKKVLIPSAVERSVLPNIRTIPIKRPIQPNVRGKFNQETVSFFGNST